jgi:putative oxidoreductase
MNRNFLTEMICCLLVALFMYTGASKFVDIPGFTGDINNQPFPNSMTPYLVWGLPLLELLIAVSLMFDKTRKAGLYASLILMLAFTVYTALVLFHYFERIPCSCGGVIKQLNWQQHLVFNLFFVLLSVAAIYLMNKKNRPKMASGGQPGNLYNLIGPN